MTLIDFLMKLLQSGWIRGLYSARCGGRGVITFVLFDLSSIGIMSGLLFCGVQILYRRAFCMGFCAVFVTVVEDMLIELVVRLCTPRFALLYYVDEDNHPLFIL